LSILELIHSYHLILLVTNIVTVSVSQNIPNPIAGIIMLKFKV